MLQVVKVLLKSLQCSHACRGKDLIMQTGSRVNVHSQSLKHLGFNAFGGQLGVHTVSMFSIVCIIISLQVHLCFFCDCEVTGQWAGLTGQPMS